MRVSHLLAVVSGSRNFHSLPTPCRCGHVTLAHEHYRRGTDCALCDCMRYRRTAAGQVAPEPPGRKLPPYAVASGGRHDAREQSGAA